MKKVEGHVSQLDKTKFGDDAEYESFSEEEEIERELSDFTFEELQKARSDGAHSLFLKSAHDRKSRRANKNRPMEVSAKRPVIRFKEVIQVPKKVVRDPRFETLCGKLDVDGFKKRYDFLFTKDMPAEKQELQKQLKKTGDPEVIEELKNRIAWIKESLKPVKHTDADILSTHKKKEREAAKQGKRPFYLKKSEIRKQRLIEKYNILKATGKLESYIGKRRRRNSVKDHRHMPYRRPNC